MKAGDALRAARALKKLKQHELAALIGVSQQMVSEWETDREPVAAKNWKALKEVLEVDCSLLDMPKTAQPITTQTTTGNSSPAQQHTGSGNMAMFDRDGITCTGLDERHAPPGINTDDWAELLYWLKRHPAMMRGVLEKARQIGAKMDDADNG